MNILWGIHWHRQWSDYGSFHVDDDTENLVQNRTEENRKEQSKLGTVRLMKNVKKKTEIQQKVSSVVLDLKI